MKNECENGYQPPKAVSRSLVPISHGEQRCEPLHFWGAGVRSCYLVHYVISGKGVFYCGTNKFTVRKGGVFVVFPDTMVKYQADADEPWHYTWVCFYGDEAKSVFADAGISVREPVIEIRNDTELLEIMRSMPSERGADAGSNLRFSAKLYELMALLVENKIGNVVSENAYYKAATRYIKAHYSEDIKVDGVASHVGISRKYLFAVFKNVSGISPKEYLINYRIERAKEFILNEELTVGSVAYSVGYGDALAFSKIFKLKSGLSPSEYRRRVAPAGGR